MFVSGKEINQLLLGKHTFKHTHMYFYLLAVIRKIILKSVAFQRLNCFHIYLSLIIWSQLSVLFIQHTVFKWPEESK